MAAPEQWPGVGDRDSTASYATALTAHAANPIDAAGARPRALWVGTGGDVAVKFAGSATEVVLANVPDGTLLPIRPTHLVSVTTTAADIVALW
jgi:hypothetical protein